MKLYLPAIFLASVLYLPAGMSKALNTSNTPSSLPTNFYLVAEQPRASVTSNWYTYTSQNGNYTVLFPTKPKEQAQSEKAASGNANFVIASYENQQQSIAYLATSIKYEQKFSASESETLLDSARDAELKSGDATLINEKKITMNGYSGKEFLAFSSKQNFYYRAKVFFDANTSTLYQVLAVSGESDINSPETTAFLNSLTIKS